MQNAVSTCAMIWYHVTVQGALSASLRIQTAQTPQVSTTSNRHSVSKTASQTTCHCAHAPVGLLSFHLILGGDFPHKLGFCMLGPAGPINASRIWKSLYVRQRQGIVGIAARV
jgi:hypothetical protein